MIGPLANRLWFQYALLLNKHAVLTSNPFISVGDIIDVTDFILF